MKSINTSLNNKTVNLSEGQRLRTYLKFLNIIKNDLGNIMRIDFPNYIKSDNKWNIIWNRKKLKQKVIFVLKM